MKQDTQFQIDCYANDRVPLGSFLTAVMENNLARAIASADLENRRDIVEIVLYVYNNIPSIAWGSPEKVEAWLAFSDIKLNVEEVIGNDK